MLFIKIVSIITAVCTHTYTHMRKRERDLGRERDLLSLFLFLVWTGFRAEHLNWTTNSKSHSWEKPVLFLPVVQEWRMATLRLYSNHTSRYQLHPNLSSGTVFVYRLWLQQKRRDWLFINKRDDLFLVLKSRGLVLASAWLMLRPSWQKAEENQHARERL